MLHLWFESLLAVDANVKHPRFRLVLIVLMIVSEQVKLVVWVAGQPLLVADKVVVAVQILLVVALQAAGQCLVQWVA